MSNKTPEGEPSAAMAQVSVSINGRQFRMACEEGQEAHLMQLARELDDRIAGLRAKFGEIGDTRLTVMAALTIADELGEMGLRITRLEQEVAAAQDAHAAAADRNRSMQAAVAAAMTSAAERIESIARKLNQGAGGNGIALG
jgi:cell division protein ZapA